MAKKEQLILSFEEDLENCVADTKDLLPRTRISCRTLFMWLSRLISLRRNRCLIAFFYIFFSLLTSLFYIVCFYTTVSVRHQRMDMDYSLPGGKAPAPFPDVCLTPRPSTTLSIDQTANPLAPSYLVYGNHCRIVDLDPFMPEVMQHFKRQDYHPCQPHLPLTRVRYDANKQRYVLRIHPAAFPSYNVSHSFGCCYLRVLRLNDAQVDFSPCHSFGSRAQLSNTTDNIIVTCSNGKRQIYINGHATIPERSSVRQRLKLWAHQDRGRRVPSVLMIGIDSVSRLNLIRAMPKTAQYLNDQKWFELAGYNKIDDNTFPNLMALLTGYNSSSAAALCSPYKVNGLEQCRFIWNLFQEHGFVTAYGEDAIKINTFNYLKKGFQQPPVDYYLRPYLSAAEKLLGGNIVLGLPHCLGFETEAEHVYNYALEFARRYRNDSSFGFFWTNTHSHSDISQTSSMDEYLRGYLQKLVAQGTMKHSIVVFFSDHGLRFGPTRATWSGHLEERLPFLFIWLPPFVQKAYPQFVEALRLNRNRLTTPYDLHMTLKHILTLSGRAGSLDSLGAAPDCPQCQSLLQPVPLNRSCKDVAIAEHWCTCWAYDSIKTNSKLVGYLSTRVVQHLNDYVTNFGNGSLTKLCEPLKLLSTNAAYKSLADDNNPSQMALYILMLYTLPNMGLYEATVRYYGNVTDGNDVVVSGSVSRLNRYQLQTSCINDPRLKMYCACREENQ